MLATASAVKECKHFRGRTGRGRTHYGGRFETLDLSELSPERLVRTSPFLSST